MVSCSELKIHHFMEYFLLKEMLTMCLLKDEETSHSLFDDQN